MNTLLQCLCHIILYLNGKKSLHINGKYAKTFNAFAISFMKRAQMSKISFRISFPFVLFVVPTNNTNNERHYSKNNYFANIGGEDKQTEERKKTYRALNVRSGMLILTLNRLDTNTRHDQALGLNKKDILGSLHWLKPGRCLSVCIIIYIVNMQILWH